MKTQEHIPGKIKKQINRLNVEQFFEYNDQLFVVVEHENDKLIAYCFDSECISTFGHDDEDVFLVNVVNSDIKWEYIYV